ncbi:MAG: putative CAMK family protein kinase [Streblomastix strix]|uniref:Putative CAMK family protein kinase n=1 Tax=Streblomastix strix TaxID=222440 RepID=A0A5J4WXB9_9EUKA|nr:MAG: putative CAMK family protein kinase [Streblomastix strix]
MEKIDQQQSKKLQSNQIRKIRSILGKKDLKSGMFRKTLRKADEKDGGGRIYPTIPLSMMVDLYLRIFLEVVEAVDSIHSYHINHYDLKCANILLGQKIAQRAARTTIYPPLPFIVTVCDFGESALYATENESYARVDKGTECVKSPEMINAAKQMHVEAPTYDRRLYVGADKKSDAWSLGCLLYELVTGYYLFHDGDNGMFQERIIRQDMDILSGAKRKRLAEADEPRLEDLLRFILQRDPNSRPTIGMIKIRVVDLLAKRHRARCQNN